ncbi:MAG: GAF domain-containing protein [Lentisphaerae bacterium]|nr:MAG: GAF domain-containing protein [Lentisphaerota bacterium]
MDVRCLYCDTINSEDAYYCSNCERSLIVGKLTSLGTGVLTKGFTYELRPTSHTLGRNIGNDFVIPSNLIMAQHLKLEYSEKGFTVINLTDRGNIFVNDEVVTDRKLLPNGALLKVGVEEFRYEFTPPTGEKVTKVPDPVTAQLQLMLGIISEFHASMSLQEVLDNAVDAVLRLTRTRRGYCFLVEETSDGATELREVSAREAGGKQLVPDESEEYTISQSIISQVLSGNGSVIIEDAMAQQVDTETIRRFKLKSIVCLPLCTYSAKTGEKHVMGIIYADHVMPTGTLPKHCRSTLQMLTDIITSTIVKWQRYEELEHTFRNLGRNIRIVMSDLQTIVEQINLLQERIQEPQQINRISPDDICLELNTIESRIQAIYTNIHQLSVANE